MSTSRAKFAAAYVCLLLAVIAGPVFVWLNPEPSDLAQSIAASLFAAGFIGAMTLLLALGLESK